MMFEKIKEIADRIKGLRDNFGEKTENIAGKLGINPAQYIEYENGKTDIPVSVLYNLAQIYNVELSSILTGEEPKLQHYCLVRKGTGIAVERRKDYKYQNLAYNFIHKKAEPFLVTVESSDKEIVLNSHHGQEFNYCLSGSIKVIIGKNELILNEGDSLFFDSSIPHGMTSINGKSSQFLAIVI